MVLTDHAGLAMLELLAHLLLTALLLLLVERFVDGIEIEGLGQAFVAAIVLGLANAIIRPLMIILTIPITLLTFGLFLLVINALVLWLAGSLSPGVRIAGFGPAFFGSLLLTLLNLVVALVFGVEL